MINIELLKKCDKCENISKIEKIYIDDKTSEEEYLIKEYICIQCNSISIYKEYINYIFDKSIFTKK